MLQVCHFSNSSNLHCAHVHVIFWQGEELQIGDRVFQNTDDRERGYEMDKEPREKSSGYLNINLITEDFFLYVFALKNFPFSLKFFFRQKSYFSEHFQLKKSVFQQ